VQATLCTFGASEGELCALVPFAFVRRRRRRTRYKAQAQSSPSAQRCKARDALRLRRSPEVI